MKKLALALFATLAISTSAYAETCKVADPTGTPLKYRKAPYGKVLGTLKNGTYVYINGYREDKNGRVWVRAFSYDNDKFLGWVFYDYLSCGE
ncbi:MAG: SH3 domain-containing protein [Moraxella sp.]|nr:SH3 domain-containing protein [Moraxella sp.]